MASNDTQTPAKPRTVWPAPARTATPTVSPRIRAEMNALADEVRSLVADGRKSGSTGFRRLRNRASDRLGEMVEAGGQVMHTMGNELASAQKRTVGAVRRHPARSMALVLGFGLLIVVLARR